MELSALRTFVEVMRRGSFAAVARDQDVAPSSVSRAIAALEEELGVRLFQRSTRRLEPTEAGRVYFERIETIVDELEHAGHMAVDMSSSPKGSLRITAPQTFGQLHIVPLLPELSATYPELSLELLLTNAIVDLLAERIDVAVRLGPLPDSTLVVSRLCPMIYVVCASPRYLEQHGRPQTPHDVQRHDCLLFPLPGYDSRWRFRKPKGKVIEVPVRGRCVISNGVALRQCAVAGMGLTMLPRWNIEQQLRDGSLVDVFPDYEVTATSYDIAAWLLYPSRDYLPLKVRVFVDFLKRKFREGPPWETAVL